MASQADCKPGCLNVVAAKLPTFLGGSADLAHSNMTYIKTDGFSGRCKSLEPNIQFGVRELHGELFWTEWFFMVDFVFIWNILRILRLLKAAVRLSALQGLPCNLCLTHDSIAVGEDGPTHEPIEHLAGSCDSKPQRFPSSRCAWNSSSLHLAVKSEKTNWPLSWLAKLGLLRKEQTSRRLQKVLTLSMKMQQIILIATGSEVNLAQ